MGKKAAENRFYLFGVKQGYLFFFAPLLKRPQVAII
jgi:hypothetical protein